MKSSIFKKVNRDVLVEWIYDDGNNIIEPYKILLNSKTQTKSFISGDTSITRNTEDNQLIQIDPIQSKYAKINYSQYSYLSYQDYVSGGIRHDKIKIYLPSNFTFGEYQGFYLRAYTYDYRNRKFYDLSNFFYDYTDEVKRGMLSSFTPPILYQDRVWDKFIEINIPSVYAISLQRDNGQVQTDTINFNLAGTDGLSQTSPIFVDFYLISKIQQIGSVKNYLTSQKVISQFPQIPELESLTLFIEESSSGDYFEIIPKYNNSVDEFANFIQDSKTLNKIYYLEFTIIVFEQNIKGKQIVLKVEEGFSDPIEFRPIIKYSSSTAIIDVEMRLIDRNNGSIVVRKSAYGMKPDQLSKYALGLKRIKIDNVNKPKIYSKNSISLHHIDELGKAPMPENRIQVPVPALINSKNISAYSPQALNRLSINKIDNYHYNGKLKVGLDPFDNILQFNLALKYQDKIEAIDLTNCQELKLSFKNDDSLIDFIQYFDGETSASMGICKFRIPESKFIDIKNLIKSGINVFHITTTNQGVKTCIYSGLFATTDVITDSGNGIGLLDIEAPSIIDDPNSGRQEVAIVTRKKIKLTTGKIETITNSTPRKVPISPKRKT